MTTKTAPAPAWVARTVPDHSVPGTRITAEEGHPTPIPGLPFSDPITTDTGDPAWMVTRYTSLKGAREVTVLVGDRLFTPAEWRALVSSVEAVLRQAEG